MSWPSARWIYAYCFFANGILFAQDHRIVIGQEESNIVIEDVIDFDTQVMAVIAKCGCNAAACHGAAGGRGGFQLSLFGSDPDLDYDQIVRERKGRRIHRGEPEESLLLMKATQSIDHQGGFRFDVGSRPYNLLKSWIQQGARRVHSRELVRLEILPPTLSLDEIGQSRTFRVFAHFSDGTRKDVSRDSVIDLLDEDTLKLANVESAETGEESKGDLTLTIERPGQHSVLVRYLDQVDLLQVTLPYSQMPTEPSPAISNDRFIDHAIDSKLSALGITAVPVADDATLFRRLSLDLLGQLPTATDVRNFVNSEDDRKLVHAVDAMLQDNRFVTLWTWHLCEWLRVGGNGQSAAMAGNYEAWIRQHVAGDASLSVIASQLLTATGDSENGATGFYRLTADPGIQAELACSTWMGVRIGCAQCHNHPLDHWKRDQYFQFAAFFAGLRRDQEIRVTSDSTLINPVTRKLAIAALPNGDQASKEDPRVDLATWITEGDNPYFAPSTANRVWSLLMGRGIYEPIDDLRQTNPISNSQLLDGLAEFHRQHHYELRALIREIVLSAAYQRQTADAAITTRDQFYWRFLPRPLPAPVLLNAVQQLSTGRRPANDPDWLTVAMPAEFSELKVLGQCDRNASCLPQSALSNSNVGLAENLELINGPIFNEPIAKAQGFLSEALQSNQTDIEILNQVYWRAFSRSPTDGEVAFWRRQLSEQPAAQAPESMWQDIIWAIFNSREFVTNH